MRTYTLESVEAKISNIGQFLRRAKNKEMQLVKLRKIRDDLLSPENAQKAVEALDRKRKEMDRLKATIALARASGALPETKETMVPIPGATEVA